MLTGSTMLKFKQTEQEGNVTLAAGLSQQNQLNHETKIRSTSEKCCIQSWPFLKNTYQKCTSPCLLYPIFPFNKGGKKDFVAVILICQRSWF